MLDRPDQKSRLVVGDPECVSRGQAPDPAAGFHIKMKDVLVKRQHSALDQEWVAARYVVDWLGQARHGVARLA